MRHLLDGFNRRFTKFHNWIYKASGGWVGHHMTGAIPSLILHTTGAKTSKPRSAVVVYAKDGNDIIVVGSNFGRDKPPAWFVNLRANPQAEVNLGHRRVPVRAEILMPGDPGYEGPYKIINDKNRHRYDRYRTMTSRPIPVVRLCRAS